MSQTPPNPADQTADSCSDDHRGLKMLSTNCNIGNHVTVRSIHPQPNLISPARKIEQQIPPRWQRELNFKAKAIALAASVLTLPVFANRTSAYYFAQAPDQVEQVRVSDAESLETDTARELPITLLVETLVAGLLLIGLSTAYFANRTIRPLRTTNNKDETSPAEQPPDAAAPLMTPRGFASNQTTFVEHQEQVAEQAHLLKEITLRIRQSLYLEDLLKTTVKEVRRALKTDRVIIYGLDPTSWEGTVVAESVAPDWPQTLRVKLDDPCFRDRHVDLYKYGQVTVINNIYEDPRVTDCYRKMLEQFGVKANLVAPILKDEQLLGLLIAHQCAEPRNWQMSDIEMFTQLAGQVGAAVDQISFLEKQEAESERARLLTEITLRLHQSQYLEDLFNTAVKEVRRVIKTDRVIIYALDPKDWDGTVVAESVAPGWPHTLKVKLDDPCFRDRHVGLYKKGQVTSINDIYQDPRVTDCYRRMLEQFGVKANLVAPIMANKQLLGLMIAHQCTEPRNWQKTDIELFTQMAKQVGFTADQLHIKEQLQLQESE